jgi:hypothetical protein
MLESLPIKGWFSSQRLRRFIPRTGTALAEAQVAIEEAWGAREDVEDKPPVQVPVQDEDVADEEEYFDAEDGGDEV